MAEITDGGSMNLLISCENAGLQNPTWVQKKHEANETLGRLAWSSIDGLCKLSGLTGACWKRVIGKNQISLVEIADLNGCSEDLVKLICSDITRQLLVMGFRPIKTSCHD